MQTSSNKLDFPEPFFTINQNPYFSYQFEVCGLLHHGKIKIYLVRSEGQYFAMKYFDDDSHLYYNEARFKVLDHPNIGAPIYAGAGASQFWKTETLVQIKHFYLTLSSFFPHGDFNQLLVDKNIRLDGKLVRTYFHQLVNAIEYMHQNSCAHTDIKLKNLMLDHKYQLKLIDFDLSYAKGDKSRSGGCKNFRAPEVLIGDESYNPYQADIFSMGVVLFVLLANKYPFPEDSPDKLKSFYANPDAYFETLKNCSKIDNDVWDEGFRKLFTGMTRHSPQKRFTFEQIRANKWFKGEIYSNEELSNVMGKLFQGKGICGY